MRSVIRIAQSADERGEVQFRRLDLRQKIDFLSAVGDVLGFTPNPLLERSALAMEVDLNCQMKDAAFIRMGKYGHSFLADYLIEGPDELRRFALDQFDHLHERNVHAYDHAYPAVLAALEKTKAGHLHDRLLILERRIERENPSATLPVVAGEILSKKEVLTNPRAVLRAELQRRRLHPENSCILALMIAKRLLSQGHTEDATVMLSQAVLYSGGDTKLLGWIGRELGDIRNASKALLAYVAEMKGKTPGERLDMQIEGYHVIELSARLLFQGDITLFYDEIGSAIRQLKQRREVEGKYFALSSAIDRLEQWISLRKGFDMYLQRRIRKSRLRDGYETVSMKLRSVAERLFLEDALASTSKQLKSGIEWFEHSAVGNDAPWILGTRSLLSGISVSLKAFSRSEKVGDRLSDHVQRLLRNSARLLQNPDPVALSLAFRGLYNSRKWIESRAILDLTRASAMLTPRTPEVAELKNRILDARWSLIEQGSHGKHRGPVFIKQLWGRIACLGPLLDRVIDEDNRLEEHFSPTPEILESPSDQMSLDSILKVENHHRRGKLLEDLIVGLVERSSDLAIVDVRHSNSFEEIDVIVKLVRSTPVLGYYGPIFMIECKNWKEKIGAEPLRSFYAKMATKKGAVRLGIFVAPSGFTSVVKEQIRQFPDSLILTVTGKELEPVISGKKTFGGLVEEMVPMSLFA